MKKIVFTLMVLLFGFTLVACSKSTYTVSFNSNGGTTVESIKDVEEGSLITKPTDPTKDGSSFEGWFKETTLETEWKFSTDKVEDNITLYAKWKDNPTVTEKVNVTFQLNYAGSPSATVVKVDKGTKVSKPTAPTREDWEFLGWSTSATGQPNFDFNSLITKNTTLYGIWKTTLETVSVSFDADNGTDVITRDQLVGELIAKFEDPVKADHIFLGWFNGEVEWNLATDLVEVEMTLKAKWQLKTREGTPISTPEELIEVIQGKIKKEEIYYLVQDIDMTGIEFAAEDSSEFLGEFDGQGFAIKNLVKQGTGRQGIFRSIKGGTITNLVIDNADISSSNERAGILASEIAGKELTANISNITIINSKVKGSHSNQSAGALTAFLESAANISNIIVTNTEIEGTVSVGGLIGNLRTEKETIISDVFLDVSVSGTDRVGGLFGSINGAPKNISIRNVVSISKLTASGKNIASLFGKSIGSVVGNITLDNMIGISEYNGTASGNIGNVVGDGNHTYFTMNDVHVYSEGLAVTHKNNMDAITNIYTIFDEAWWATNLKDLTENELWKKDVSGIYVMGDSTYTAPNHKIVTFKDGDNVYKFSVKSGNTVNNLILSKEGFELLGWKLDGVTFDFSQVITEDITLISDWLDESLLEEYTVNFETDGGTEIESQTVIQNSLVIKPETDPIKEGFEFEGWYLGEELFDFNTIIEEDITLTAKWLDINDIIYFDITYMDGEIEIEVVKVREGTAIIRPVNPVKEGFIFVEWQLDGVTFEFNQTASEALTLQATWREIGAAIEISTTDELIQLFQTGGSENYKLMNDLDFTGIEVSATRSIFTGVLNGGGFTVSNIHAEQTLNKSAVFFGTLSDATIMNLRVSESSIKSIEGGQGTGFISSYAYGATTFKNLEFINVSIKSTGNYSGLLFSDNEGEPENQRGMVKTVSEVIVINDSTAEITAAKYASALVGSLRYDVNVNFNDIFIDANVSTTVEISGLVIGRNQSTSGNIKFENIVVMGKSAASKQTGALIGDSVLGSTLEIKNVLVSNFEAISNNSEVDSLIGRNKSVINSLENVYYEKSTVNLIANGKVKVPTQGVAVTEPLTQEWLETSGLSTELFKIEEGKIVLNK